MDMHLNHQPFVAIKNGTKTIEIRLNDEKRSQLQVGDVIKFTDLTTAESIEKVVIGLEKFSTFKDLFKKYSGTVIGEPENLTVEELDQENQTIYSRKCEQKYGALAIELEH